MFTITKFKETSNYCLLHCYFYSYFTLVAGLDQSLVFRPTAGRHWRSETRERQGDQMTD